MNQRILLIKGCPQKKAEEIISLLKEKIFPNAEIDLITNHPYLFLNDKRISGIYSGRTILEGFVTLSALQKKRFDYLVMPFLKNSYFKYRVIPLLYFGKRLLIFNEDLSYSYWNKGDFLYYPFKKNIKHLTFLVSRLVFLSLSFINLFICIGILFGKKIYYTCSKILHRTLQKARRAIYNTYSFMFAMFSLPFILFLAASFFMENIIWRIFIPVLNKIVPRRKLVAFEDLKASLIIPNWNGIGLLKECLPSVFSAEGFWNGKNEVLVIDDGSTDGSVDYIRSNFPQVRLILNKRNKGFGPSCNRGVKEAKNELIVLINNDIIVTDNFLNPLMGHFQDKDIFAVTPKLYAWDRKTFATGMNFGYFKHGYIKLYNEAETGNGDRVYQPSPSIYAIGAAMAFRKRDFLWLGGFDKIYRPNCWEDIDISYRAWKRGLKVIYEPNSVMYHKGKATITYERHKEIKNELSFIWKNITDERFLMEHLRMLPWYLYKGKYIFLRGLLWAFGYLPKTLFHRLMERRFIKVEDKKIFDTITLYYRNL